MKIIQIFGDEGDTLAIVVSTTYLKLNNVAFRVVGPKTFKEIVSHESKSFIRELRKLSRILAKSDQPNIT